MNKSTVRPYVGQMILIAAMSATLLPAIVYSNSNLGELNLETGRFDGTLDVVVLGHNGNGATVRSGVPQYSEESPNTIGWEFNQEATLPSFAREGDPIYGDGDTLAATYGGFNPLSSIMSFGLDQVLAFALASLYLSNRTKIAEAAQHIIAPAKLAGILAARLGIHNEDSMQDIEEKLVALADALSGTLIAVGDAKVATQGA